MIIQREAAAGPAQEYRILLSKLSLTSLASANRILDEQAMGVLRSRYEEVQQSGEQIIGFLDFLISFLVEQLDSFLTRERSEVRRTTRSELLLDYQILQEAIQKSQAEVRNHIKIEHQFKIYLEGLEERIEELQKQLGKAEAKNETLSEAMRELLREKKALEERVERGEAERKQCGNEMFSNSRIYKDAFVSWKYTGNKSKKLIEKSNDRIIKALHKKSLSKKEGDKSFQINRTKSSHKMPTPNVANVAVNQQQSFKELVQTLQMKHCKNHNGKAAHLFSYKADFPDRSEGKLYRSNSVCH